MSSPPKMSSKPEESLSSNVALGAKSLSALATIACIKHKNDIISVGDLRYSTVRDILRKIQKVDQLRQIEQQSPQICGEDAELWYAFIKRDICEGEDKLQALESSKACWKVYDYLHREDQADNKEKRRIMAEKLQALAESKKTTKRIASEDLRQKPKRRRLAAQASRNLTLPKRILPTSAQRRYQPSGGLPMNAPRPMLMDQEELDRRIKAKAEREAALLEKQKAKERLSMLQSVEKTPEQYSGYMDIKPGSISNKPLLNRDILAPTSRTKIHIPRAPISKASSAKSSTAQGIVTGPGEGASLPKSGVKEDSTGGPKTSTAPKAPKLTPTLFESLHRNSKTKLLPQRLAINGGRISTSAGLRGAAPAPSISNNSRESTPSAALRVGTALKTVTVPKVIAATTSAAAPKTTAALKAATTSKTIATPKAITATKTVSASNAADKGTSVLNAGPKMNISGKPKYKHTCNSAEVDPNSL